ncbi:hypothetical protein K9N68_28490 [Kovacikia minuta CCNUW1]|uniref:hypothetical protein n=1 Tax=Kovacikia minuta TaxID=2931930 RepID=UPI001CCFFBC4|nr:hypothetical protein [Kovacikia minuta]UBF25480.1 hypothetical protein K9N68_28490 [Kovacikia minuta CCNUW1]
MAGSRWQEFIASGKSSSDTKSPNIGAYGYRSICFSFCDTDTLRLAIQESLI